MAAVRFGDGVEWRGVLEFGTREADPADVTDCKFGMRNPEQAVTIRRYCCWMVSGTSRGKEGPDEPSYCGAPTPAQWG